MKGRGSGINPKNRFSNIDTGEAFIPPPEKIRTQFFPENVRQIFSRNTSPDIPFEYGLNPYKGCEHGCIYCYARPYHEYNGLSAGLDFEQKIFVKHQAPELIRKTFNKKSWNPQTIMMSGATDPYQPGERKFEISRKCLEVFAEYRNPVAIITKNALVARDLDILVELSRFQAVRVYFSVTSLDPKIIQHMEPRTSRPDSRLKAMNTLASSGIPVGVSLGPIIPGLTDHETPALLQAAKDHGATSAFYTFLRLPLGVKDLFEDWLTRYFPNQKNKVLEQIRLSGTDQQNSMSFEHRMRGEGAHAAHIRSVFNLWKRKLGFNQALSPLETKYFRTPHGKQTELF